MASTHSDVIIINIISTDGHREQLEVPVNINLSLMEVLRANGYPIPGTCGGIALCATCAVEVLSGEGNLSPAGDQELDMLDMLPETNNTIRLACQIRLTPEMNGITIRMANLYNG